MFSKLSLSLIENSEYFFSKESFTSKKKKEKKSNF